MFVIILAMSVQKVARIDYFTFCPQSVLLQGAARGQALSLVFMSLRGMAVKKLTRGDCFMF